MYTEAEYQVLCGTLSNAARVLYCLGLRPFANTITGASAPLNYKSLVTLLSTDEQLVSRGRELNSILQELVGVGLVALPQGADLTQSLNQSCVVLPLSVAEPTGTHQHSQRITLTADWQPNDEIYSAIAKLLGIIDASYSKEELGEFIAYWLGRPNAQFTAYEWHRKFAINLKQKRTATNMTPVKQVGSQLVKPVSSLEADENARKLVAKYSGNQSPPSKTK